MALTLRMFTRILRKAHLEESHLINQFIEKHFSAIKAIESASVSIGGNWALIQTSRTWCCSHSATWAPTRASSPRISSSSLETSSAHSYSSSSSWSAPTSSSTCRTSPVPSSRSQPTSATSQIHTQQFSWRSTPSIRKTSWWKISPSRLLSRCSSTPLLPPTPPSSLSFRKWPRMSWRRDWFWPSSTRPWRTSSTYATSAACRPRWGALVRSPRWKKSSLR